ncbi:MAG TPA: SIS domain-containing protein [Anaerolineales bacterium]|nr:SIS domain-containing protein [Anaerolineales bacterium]
MEDLVHYLAHLKTALGEISLERVEAAVAILQEARVSGKTIFVLGNGGSAATASHIVCDLAKNTRRRGQPLLRVLGLSDNMPIVSAYANDEGYDMVFAAQLANLVNPGDVVIGISTSGNSPNVLRAMEVAKEHGAVTIGFTGFDGGRLAAMVDLDLRAPGARIEHAEDIHLVLEHMITARLRAGAEEWEVVPGLASLAVAKEVVPATGASAERLGDMSRLLQLAVECVGATSGSTVLLNQHGQVLASVLLYQGEVRQPHNGEMEETLERGLAGWVVNNRSSALVDDTRQDPRWLAREWEGKAEGTRSAMSIPLEDDGRVLGALTLVHSGSSRFTQEDLALVSALASRLLAIRSSARAEA